MEHNIDKKAVHARSGLIYRYLRQSVNKFYISRVEMGKVKYSCNE